MEYNFLAQVVKSVRRDVLLDLVLTNKKGLVGNVWAGGSLGCSDKVEFGILHGRNKVVGWIANLEFRKANSDLIKDLLGDIPWVRILK